MLNVMLLEKYFVTEIDVNTLLRNEAWNTFLVSPVVGPEHSVCFHLLPLDDSANILYSHLVKLDLSDTVSKYIFL